MIQYTKKLIASAVIALATLSAPAFAAPLDFSFSFTNGLLNGGGTVTGIVRGLTDDATSAASSFKVTGNTLGFGLGEYIGNPTFNTWTLVAGVLTDWDFLAFGSKNTGPAVTSSSIRLRWDLGDNEAGLTNFPGRVNHPPNSDLVFTPLAAVPLPAALPMLFIALGGLGFAARRKRA